MTEPRTEQEAESRLLTVYQGGQSVRLPVLSILQSEEWQSALAHLIAGLEVHVDSLDGEEVIHELMKQGTDARLVILDGYDITDVLGGIPNIKATFSQRELGDAVEALLDAEFPFDEAGKRSVVEALGLPLKVMGLASEAIADELSASVKSASGRLAAGVLDTTESEPNGAASNSQSDGTTASAAKPKKRRTKH